MPAGPGCENTSHVGLKCLFSSHLWYDNKRSAAYNTARRFLPTPAAFEDSLHEVPVIVGGADSVGLGVDGNPIAHRVTIIRADGQCPLRSTGAGELIVQLLSLMRDETFLRVLVVERLESDGVVKHLFLQKFLPHNGIQFQVPMSLERRDEQRNERLQALATYAVAV